ncbi:hypothetical protein BH11PLA1_BH11PLA1_16830 [soil metagenome]
MPATLALSSFAGLAFSAPGLFSSAGLAHQTGPASGTMTCNIPRAELTTLSAAPSNLMDAALRMPSLLTTAAA